VKEKPKPDKETFWSALAGAQKVKLTLADQKATGKVRLTAPEKGVVPYAIQVVITAGDGKRLLTQLATHAIDFGEVVVVKKPEKNDPPPAPIILKDKVVQSLGSTITNAIIGGDGRYLILHLGQKRKLVIWDVYLSKIVKELAVASDNVKMATSLDKLIVVLPEQKLIQRYSLKTFERELTQVLRVKGTVTGTAMGHASTGPLFLGLHAEGGGDPGVFLDPLTLQTLDYDWDGARMPGFSADHLRVSANGQVFTARQGVGGEPHSCVAIILNGRKAKSMTAGLPGSILLPSPDGHHICMEQGLMDGQMKRIGPQSPDVNGESPFLPAHQGKYFMHFQRGMGMGAGIGRLSVYIPGHDKPIGIVEEIEGYIGQTTNYGRLPNHLMHDRRVFFVPEAKVLISVPLSNDQIVIRPLDIDALLARSGFDFLFVVSNPPLTARGSTAYTYQIAAKSNKGGIKYKLESGPKGMKVSPQGLVEWEVPKKTDKSEHEVVISVTDAAGQECFHTFTINVE
jgi:hypothetical protein